MMFEGAIMPDVYIPGFENRSETDRLKVYRDMVSCDHVIMLADSAIQ